ncbi:hypothetical protein CLOM_g13677 [Closterium sp. NIES-68]|nr:hypothetical protein CLOM_g6229 [Closterium sp. NIES-68]GJP54605.1 hypothetical protein CLOM_g13677 [Closterium sp. NIES-68]
MQVTFTEWHYLPEFSTPAPKGFTDDIRHLAYRAKGSAWLRREKSQAQFRINRNMAPNAKISWLEQMFINAAFHDADDGEDFVAEAGRFLQSIADYKNFNPIADGWNELLQAPRRKLDYRTWLLDWAHSMGWVLEGGPYTKRDAPNAMVVFGKNGKPVPEALIPPARKGWIGGPNGISMSNLARALGLRPQTDTKAVVHTCEFREVDSQGREWRCARRGGEVPINPRLVKQDYAPRGYWNVGFPDSPKRERATPSKKCKIMKGNAGGSP